MQISAADRELFWQRLLQIIERGRVVPVVGQSLLTLPLGEREVPLYRLLAERLAEHLMVDVAEFPRGGELDAVAYSFLARGGNVQYLYSSLLEVMPPPHELPLPLPLLQLARIDKLRLFITTTCDSLLARALDETRFGGRPQTRVFSYSPGAAEPGELGDSPAAVLHLFGKLSAMSSEFALTEEDKLEFVHSLQGEGARPHVLEEAAERPLLVLGTGFPDWLTRFFLRIGSGTRLSAPRAKTDVFADGASDGQEGLVLFLRHFGPGIQIFPGDAAEFVAELARRWELRHPPPAAGVSPPAGPPAEAPGTAHPEPQQGAIFLSYASEDLVAARALRDALADRNLEVWFDKEALEGGDDYRLKIRRAIQSSCLFIPILSRHTLTEAPRFFRREWSEAVDLAPLFPPNRPFILPVAVDDIAASEEALPELFRTLHWTRLPEGRADEKFVGWLRELYRKYQQREREGAA